MNPEQIGTVIATVITNVLTGGGLAIFFYYLIKGLKTEIKTLNGTIEQQNKTLEVMEKRVIETEKVGNIYRDLIDDLPEQVAKYKKFINQTKDDVIEELSKAQDETVKETRQLELKKLELQDQMLSEIPKLREQLITAFEAIEQRIAVMNPSPWVPLSQSIKIDASKWVKGLNVGRGRTVYLYPDSGRDMDIVAEFEAENPNVDEKDESDD